MEIMMKKTESGRIRKIKQAAAWALTLAFLLSACGMAKNSQTVSQSSYDAGAGQENYASYREDGGEYEAAREEGASVDYVAEAEPAADAAAAEKSAGDAGEETAGGEPADLLSENRKIIYSGNVSLQTLEYDQSAKSIHDRISQSGGFIESEDTSNDDPYWYYKDRTGSSARRTRRYLNITARIPADKFDSFMEELKNDGQVINTSVNARNISVSYATHDASRKALEIEQARLLEMMDKAETIEEMISVEKRLTEVERELGDEKTTLSEMDRDVNFSTVYISLEEVFEYSESVVEVTYGERLKRAFNSAIDGFVDFWGELVLFIVGTFPFLIMLAVIVVLIVKLVRRGNKRRLEKRAAREAARRTAGTAGDPVGFTPPISPAPQAAEEKTAEDNDEKPE